MTTERHLLCGEAGTGRLGAELAGRLAPGDLVSLEGDLGAGKSSLARALIRSLLDDPGLDVPSPSFALVQPYQGAGLYIVHADLYRLVDPIEAEELGLFEAGDAIVILEWAERVPGLAERARLRIALELAEGGASRQATLTWRDGS